jgi:transposase-like protein
MAKHYSEDFKQMIIQKVMMPGSPGIIQISEKNGVHHDSVRRWIRSCGNESTMKKPNKLRSPEQKLQAIIETSSMTENELGEYLRKNGLHSADLNEWKVECLSGFKSPGRPKKSSEVVELRKEKKELKKNLHRKDKALAEMSARVILLKKSHEIFGDSEDDD